MFNMYITQDLYPLDRFTVIPFKQYKVFNTHKFCCWALKLNLVNLETISRNFFEIGLMPLGSWIGIFQCRIRIIISWIYISNCLHTYSQQHSYWILLRLLRKRLEQRNKYIISFHDISAFGINGTHQICNSNKRAAYSALHIVRRWSKIIASIWFWWTSSKRWFIHICIIYASIGHVNFA